MSNKRATTVSSDDFAKIFRSDCGRQILVIRENNDDGDPALKFSVLVGGDLDVCSISMSFKSDKARDKLFSLVDQSGAQDIFDKLMSQASEFITH